MEGTVFGAAAAVLFFLLFQACGMAVAGLALPGERLGSRLLLGSVAGSLMLQWLPALFAFFFGFSLAAHIAAACLAAVCGGICLLLGRKRKISVPAAGESFRSPFLGVIFFVWLFFCALVWRSFRYENGRIFSSQATYGDMCMHLSFITSMARQGRFPPEYSLLPGFRLSYPFLGDSISASLYLLGNVPLRLAYTLPMFFAGAQVLLGFYLFASRLCQSRKKGAFAWTFFFFNGGFGFLYFLQKGEDFTRIFRDFYQTPTNLVEKSIRWVNVIVDMMLPQRATLFGWAVLFPALYLLYRAVYDNEKRYFFYAGVLAGLLPMIHTHSFVALALCCGVWLFAWALRCLEWGRPAVLAGKCLVAAGLPLMWLVQFLLKRHDKLDAEGLLWFCLAVAGLFVALLAGLLVLVVRRRGGRELASAWGVLLLTACVLALPQLCYWTFRQVGTNDMIRGHFGWAISQGEDSYLWFYLKNLGLVGILALLGLFTAKGETFGKYAPALFLWFLAEFVEFQPNDYDNNKLLYPAFALLCCCAAEFSVTLLEKIKQRGLRGTLTFTGACVCLCSALLTMGREWVAKYELFGTGALAVCDYVEENLPADAVILTDARHNNEIASLSGRNIVCGSPAYLFFHGLPYYKREYAAREMYEKPREAEHWYREMKVDYVLISDFEHPSYQVDEDAIAALFPKLYDDGVRKLYKVEWRNGP